MTHPHEDKRKKCACEGRLLSVFANHTPFKCWIDCDAAPTSTQKEEKMSWATERKNLKEFVEKYPTQLVTALDAAYLSGVDDSTQKSPDKEALSESVDSKEVKKIVPQDTDKGCCEFCAGFRLTQAGVHCSNPQCQCHVGPQVEGWIGNNYVPPTSPRFTADSKEQQSDKGDTICRDHQTCKADFNDKCDARICEEKGCHKTAPTDKNTWEKIWWKKSKHYDIASSVRPLIVEFISNLLSTEKGKVTSMCVPVHLFIKQKEEMYALGKTQGKEIGRIEAINQIKKMGAEIILNAPHHHPYGECCITDLLTSLDTMDI